MLETIKNSCIEAAVYVGKSGFVICSIKDLVHGKEWIYKKNGITEDRSTKKTFDEQYAGGMEFIFPSDEEEVYGGQRYKDHGILWRASCTAETKDSSIEAHGFDSELGMDIRYCIELHNNKMFFSIKLCNTSLKGFSYLARLHPAFCIEPGTEFTGNGDEIFFEEGRKYCDFLRGEVFYHILQNKGEFVLKDKERSISFQYEQEKFPYLTICSFVKEGVRIGIIEPANAAGASLNSAVKRGSIPVLRPGETLTYDFTIIPE